MPTVRNLVTGLEHGVPAGHFSLTDAEYEVLPEPEPEVEPEVAPAAIKARPARARKE